MTTWYPATANIFTRRFSLRDLFSLSPLAAKPHGARNKFLVMTRHFITLISYYKPRINHFPLWSYTILVTDTCIWRWAEADNSLPSGHFNVESTLNQRQTSTLKQRWNMVGFESWMDIEMTTLNQRRLPDVDSTSGFQRWINVDCLTLNQLHIISIQPSVPTITQHSYATLMQWEWDLVIRWMLRKRELLNTILKPV